MDNLMNDMQVSNVNLLHHNKLINNIETIFYYYYHDFN